jgi:hypothetical protein
MGRRNLVLSEDQRAARWNEIRELRTKVAVAEKLQKARAAKGGTPMSAVPTDINVPPKDTEPERTS